MSELSTICNHKKKVRYTLDDDVYLKKIRFSCPFCKNTGKKTIYKDLWKLKIHFHREHLWDLDCQRIIADLENYVRIGVLRE